MHSTLFWKNIYREKYDMMQDMYVQRLPNLPVKKGKVYHRGQGVQNI
jgi:hypothetical protein